MKFFYCIATVVALVGTLATGTAIAQTSPVAPMGAISAASSDGRTADTWLRDGDTFSIQYGVYTKHRSYSAEHVDHNRMVNLEIQSNYDRVWGADKTLFGASVLRNSFGQPSQWVYWGQRRERLRIRQSNGGPAARLQRQVPRQDSVQQSGCGTRHYSYTRRTLQRRKP